MAPDACDALRHELERARRVTRSMTDQQSLRTLHNYIFELEDELQRSERRFMLSGAAAG